MLRIVIAVLVLCALTSSVEAKRLAKKQSIAEILAEVASEVGLPLSFLRKIARRESGMRPDARTGSYKGLFQLSNTEFKKYGGTGDIYDAKENALAFGRRAAEMYDKFVEANGRKPSATDLYMIHQQGKGGYDAHMSDPDAPAWENMYATPEGKRKGKAWSKRAIWGNIPVSERKKYGSVEDVTSRDFVNLWAARVEDTAPAQEDAGSYTPSKYPSMTVKPASFKPVAAQSKPGAMSTASAYDTEDDEPAKSSPTVRSDPTPQEPFFTKERLDQAFGPPFGELYTRPNSDSVPSAPPLFKDLFA